MSTTPASGIALLGALSIYCTIGRYQVFLLNFSISLVSPPNLVFTINLNGK